MNKYKLINKQTNEEHLCDKVTIDGYDYYAGGNYKDGDYAILPLSNTLVKCVNGTTFIEGTQKVIATNNPNIDILKLPNIDILKVVDKVKIITNNWLREKGLKENSIAYTPFIEGYNKSQETHPFSEEDMIEFAEWRVINLFFNTTDFSTEKLLWKSNNKLFNGTYTTKELLQIWKEQKPKTLYYE